ncbi:MAG TPA: response regulator [Segetibacter sp.]|jgi:CheY-like chemotaxis protein
MLIKSVLMVDDDPDDRLLFLEAVAEIDPSIKCTTASCGTDALQMLKNEDVPLPDIIFLDLNMPKMDGKQCLKHVKKIPALSSIPLVIYSTSKMPLEIEETKKLGADYFLTKPISMKDLKKELLFLLSKNWGE